MPTTKITIKFRRTGKNTHLYSGEFSYRSASSAVDQLNISTKIVQIDAERASSKSTSLQVHNSTFYKQIIKSLCLYYILEQSPNQIREIALTRRSGAKCLETEVISSSKINQVISKTTNLSRLADIDSAKAFILLSETPGGRSVLNACTYLIKSLDSSSVYDRFEKLWRAFNALYKAFAKQSTDHGCHVALRNHII